MEPSPTYRLRLIEAADNEEVANLIRAVMTEFGAVGPGYSIEDPEVDTMYETYQQPGHRFWVITDEKRVLGCGGIGPLQGAAASICELKKMYFYPALRGKGWGKKLVEVCLESAKACGYQTIYLETIARMEQANGLYIRMGFKKLDHYMGATGHSACELSYARPVSSN